MVPVARALEAGGHEVGVATSASFAPMVEAAGLRPFAAGLDWLQSDSDSAMPGFMEADGPGQGVRRRQFATRGMVDDLVTIAGEWRPQRDPAQCPAEDLAGWVAAEPGGIAHARRTPSGAPAGSNPAHVDPRHAGHTPRHIHGLGTDRDLSRMTSYLYLNFVPESFEMAPPEVLRYVLQSMTVDSVTPLSSAQAIASVALGEEGAARGPAPPPSPHRPQQKRGYPAVAGRSRAAADGLRLAGHRLQPRAGRARCDRRHLPGRAGQLAGP